MISGFIISVFKNIVIYDKENCINKEFLDIIENVFGNRVIYVFKYIKCELNKNVIKNVDIYL